MTIKDVLDKYYGEFDIWDIYKGKSLYRSRDDGRYDSHKDKLIKLLDIEIHSLRTEYYMEHTWTRNYIPIPYMVLSVYYNPKGERK